MWIDECKSKALIEVKCEWNDVYVQGVLTCTHKQLNECMKLSWVKGGVLGWTLFVSWDEVFSSNLTTS